MESGLVEGLTQPWSPRVGERKCLQGVICSYSFKMFSSD